MFNQDEEKIGNREIGFWQGKKAEFVLILFVTSVAGICGIYLSLALGTAKYEKLD